MSSYSSWLDGKEIVSQEDVMKVTQMISKVTNLITSSSSSAVAARHWDVHAGLTSQQWLRLFLLIDGRGMAVSWNNEEWAIEPMAICL